MELRGATLAQKFFTRCFSLATHSRLKSMAEGAKLFLYHLANVRTYLRHHLTNARLEVVNATIKIISAPGKAMRAP